MCMIDIFCNFSCTSFEFRHNKVICIYDKLANDDSKVGNI